MGPSIRACTGHLGIVSGLQGNWSYPWRSANGIGRRANAARRPRYYAELCGRCREIRPRREGRRVQQPARALERTGHEFEREQAFALERTGHAECGGFVSGESETAVVWRTSGKNGCARGTPRGLVDGAPDQCRADAT